MIHSEIQSMFPAGTISGRDGSGVNGLASGTVPVGEILAAGRMTGETDRIFYLVKCEKFTYILRVCKAMEGSGYAEFAVIHDAFDHTGPYYAKEVEIELKRFRDGHKWYPELNKVFPRP